MTSSLNVDSITPLKGSFRDPSGFVFRHDDVLYRQVNIAYREHYEWLVESGLYKQLVAHGRLIPHEEVAGPVGDPSQVYRILRPEPVEFVSYPYEWCFNELKDAALLTLDVQQLALRYEMTLIDASAFNIQFHMGRPVMIDTLSFRRYSEGQAWLGYRQFCQHFLAPLALMATKDVRMNQLLRVYLDGIPLDLVSRLLPRRTWLSPSLAVHLHVHAKTQKAQAATDRPKGGDESRFHHVSREGLVGVLNGLRSAIDKLNWEPEGTEWAEYYQNTNYSDTALEHKGELVREYLETVQPTDVWDLGANKGVFSRIAADRKIPTVAFDIDPAAVEANYRLVKRYKEANILPLLLDLSNPSPGLGWNESERDSFMQRGPADCALALALIHHLAISNNVPLNRIAEFFAGLCRYLVIEFVPKEDNQVQRLLRSRVDIFGQYDQQHFEQAFGRLFSIHRAELIRASGRVLYLMENNQKRLQQ